MQIAQQEKGIHDFYTKKHKTTQAQSCRKTAGKPLFFIPDVSEA